MSYSRGQYYEQSSRSRSRDRKYRREYRDDGYRYSSSYGGGGGSSEYAGGRSSGGSYGAGRRSSRPSHAVESQSHHHGGGGGGSEYDESKFVLAVFNLSIYTTESELYDVFSKFGPLKKATVVIDAKTGRSRGFGFVYFESTEDAKEAHEQANGIEIGDRRIRVDFSATEKPHDPTPGVYYGKVSYPKGGGGGGGGGYGGAPPLGPPAPVAAPGGGGGYYHCRACEIEARERERWEPAGTTTTRTSMRHRSLHEAAIAQACPDPEVTTTEVVQVFADSGHRLLPSHPHHLPCPLGILLR
ncbi:hypothetical protein RP20_CCG008878 [Aedes albopictus]|nr:hypothetical protein RP20_CCG008878 [Aedes albopictus]